MRTTPYPVDEKFLLEQLKVLGAYQVDMEKITNTRGVSPALMAGVMSRESACGLALKPMGPTGTGDFKEREPKLSVGRTGRTPPDGGGFGRGLMQIDYDWHGFARMGEWRNPHDNIDYSAKMIRSSWNIFLTKWAGLTPEFALRCALASYNCGYAAVCKAMLETTNTAGIRPNPDKYTTGGDYSVDVLFRVQWFEQNGLTTYSQRPYPR